MNGSRRKLALVTGAAGGIGRALANELARHGYDIFAVDRLAPELAQLGSELVAAHPTLRFQSVVMDLAKPDAAEMLHQASIDDGARVDLLVNNVGFGKMGEHVLQSLQAMTDMLSLNNLLMTKLCLLFGNDMKARGDGQILNIASLVGFSASPFFAAYSGTKAYAIAFSVAIARELGPHGVHVSCLCPGTTESGFLDAAEIADVSAAGMRRFSSAFIATPETVARAGVKGMLERKLVIVPTAFLSLQSFLLRVLPVEFVSGIVHDKIVNGNGKLAA